MIRMPSLAHIRPNCVTATSPRSSCCAVGSFTYTFFQSVYSALGMPYLLTHLRNTATAAQVVSCSLNSASARLVASSTMFIRKHFDPRSSNQACWLPSNCTSSPKCCFLSRRFRCVLGLRSQLHKLASSIQRRNVSGCTFNPSSLFKCSAANVGPNRLPTSPLYFSPISANARSRRGASVEGGAPMQAVDSRLRTGLLEKRCQWEPNRGSRPFGSPAHTYERCVRVSHRKRVSDALSGRGTFPSAVLARPSHEKGGNADGRATGA